MEQRHAYRSLASQVRRRLTYANVAATLALVLASGGTATAAVMITSNSQVAQNTISGHAAPSGKHANLISGSVNATDLNASVKTSLTDRCASDMQLIEGLCIELNERAQGNFNNAAAKCESLGRRLPDFGEMTEVLNASGAPSDSLWTSDVTEFEGSGTFDAIAAGQNSNRQLEYFSVDVEASLPYLCVSTPTD